MDIPCGRRKCRSSACRVQLSSSIYMCVVQWTGGGGWGKSDAWMQGKWDIRMQSEYGWGENWRKAESLAFIYAFWPPGLLCSVPFVLWSSWCIRAEMTDVSAPWCTCAEMMDVSSPWCTRAEMTDVSSPWYTLADMIEWDAEFMRWSIPGMIPCREKTHQTRKCS